MRLPLSRHRPVATNGPNNSRSEIFRTRRSARSGPAWARVSQTRTRQHVSSRIGVHAVLTVRDVRVAGMVAALYGVSGSALRADRNHRDALCCGRNASAVTSAY